MIVIITSLALRGEGSDVAAGLGYNITNYQPLSNATILVNAEPIN